MIPEYTKSAPGEEFAEPQSQFRRVVSWLRSPEALATAHGELEDRLVADGRELLRLLFQSHLDLRALREPRLVEVTGEDGVVRRHVRPAIRRLMTVFGPVRVGRLRYGGRGTTSLFPADAGLNLPEEEYSHGMRRRAAEEAAKVSYKETVDFLARHTGGQVAPRQTQELVRRAARDFDTFYEEGLDPGREETDDLLVMSLDGKGIVMRREHLREATRKAAEQGSPKLGRRLSKGEKRNRKRMATVAAVYTIEPFPRVPEDVMSELRPARDVRRSRPRARNKRVWASVEKDAATVTREVLEEACARDPEHRRRWVVLVDGDRHQIARIQSEARRCEKRVVLVVDLIHVLEYLWRAAWSFFEEGDKAAERWVIQRALRILEGRSSNVAAGIRRSATKRNLPAKRRKGVDRCADYLIAKRKFLRYDQYLRHGLPIATGVIEGACRHLVKDRLDITGARWGISGAEAVLRLRALRSSGDFDAYWSFHLERELMRNHLIRYPEGEIPEP